ncbi:hypothetical protein D3C81_394870 [compost metagenome]
MVLGVKVIHLLHFPRSRLLPDAEVGPYFLGVLDISLKILRRSERFAPFRLVNVLEIPLGPVILVPPRAGIGLRAGPDPFNHLRYDSSPRLLRIDHPRCVCSKRRSSVSVVIDLSSNTRRIRQNKQDTRLPRNILRNPIHRRLYEERRFGA